ncbi:P-loop containing nucleoside triphosphate hydrolase protein [Mycena pura]|uniref:DNA 3'-5' helicase n=1 Tax=Mycena pura TaxID=153505 RepID=A0AAD6YTX8_9AGAR|nr:P-loop containing nucleoside triphosphate hydrolase protein [Mycena pura]
MTPATSETSLQFLNSLNAAQLQAVIHAPTAPLQIMAGPGSGKTKVLTSRIAYLILHHLLPPSSICAVTFTNKAANEMRERLGKLIGKQRTSEVRMGTFHALCALFLRKLSDAVGIKSNFTVCDADESKKIISGLLKPYKDYMSSKDISLKDGTVLSLISKAKAKGLTAKDFIAEYRKPGKAPSSAFDPQDDIQHIVGNIYQDYEKSLRRSNSLDFDDLLLFGVKLFAGHPPATSWCSHVLVDEFQDTNMTQYELLRALGAATNGCVTVVGDPDQSIYGWRSAEVENLAKMNKDFVGTQQIYLEENYRSTASILKASLAIVSQDKSRIPKRLLTSHPFGTTPVLLSFASEQAEATFIAVEIKRLVASMGGVLRWSDFAVLLRFSALSRAIESALQKEAIPSAILGGHKFFERQEIKDILAYLQLVDNPNFNPALIRAINIPNRGVGEKSISALVARADKTKMSPFEVIELIYDSKQPDIKPAMKHKVGPFVRTVRALRKLATEGASPPDLVQRLLDLIEYEDHLKKTQPDWESRWENVQELITFASDVEHTVNLPNSDSIDPNLIPSDTPLRLFLQASMLSSEGDHHREEDGQEKVTISTCHAAKGLEWPVVIIPAVEQGTFPFYRTDDVQEERYVEVLYGTTKKRRLLYVACTRAQSLLYLSHVSKRKFGGETKTKEISEFVATATREHSTIFTSRTSQLPAAERDVISRVLRRPLAQEAEVTRRVTEFRKTRRYLDFNDAGQPEVPWHPASGLSPESPRQIGSPVNSVTFVASGSMATAASLRCPPKTVLPSTVRNQFVHQQPVSSSHDASVLVMRTQNADSKTEVPGPEKPLVAVSGVKRRLGMGRGTMGFPNKKFKPPIIHS